MENKNRENKNLAELVSDYLLLHKQFITDKYASNIHQQIMQDVEKSLINFALEHSKFNQAAAARILGIGRSTLLRKIKQFNLNPNL